MRTSSGRSVRDFRGLAPRDSTARLYATAIKPGIVISNTLLAAAAYVFAASTFSLPSFLGLIFGTACVVASGCVLNNHFDREIDARMTRTAGRGQATGAMTVRGSIVYCALLGLSGLVLLVSLTNPFTALLGVFGWVMYALVYTQAKHRTVHATLIGTVPGALPPVAGIAATGAGRITDAVLLFLLLVAWQVVHFYAISIRRGADYRAAGVPVPALVYGVSRTKWLMTFGSLVFLAAVVALRVFGSAGVVLTLTLGVGGMYWLLLAVTGLRKDADSVQWARRMFIHSLAVIAALCAVLFLDPLLA